MTRNTEQILKKHFMEAAIQDIKTSADRAPKHPAFLELKKVCIPVPFADFDFYFTKGLLVWTPNPGQKMAPVIVPEGFCTDLTSVPQLFWSIYPKTGRYAYAAIAHDYLYWTQSTSREEADDVLFTAMEDSQVNYFTKWTIYGMVRKFGQSSWDANATAKTTGEKRFLKVFPDEGQLVSWANWKNVPAHFAD